MSYDYAAAGRRGARARKSVGGGWVKGRRRNATGMTEREYQALLAEIASAVREPARGERSIRVVAAHCGVSDRTVRHWLDGTNWASAPMARRLEGWLRSVRR